MKRFLVSVLMGMAFLPMYVFAQSLSAQGLNYADGWAVKAPVEKPRVIITADAELDDSNSLIRFLLFSTDYKVEGLIYTSKNESRSDETFFFYIPIFFSYSFSIIIVF